ncbi:MAG: transcription termination factor NusA [Dehalococcoidia bacterium]
MKNDFLVAINQLAAEKNLPKEAVFEAVEAALASAYKKDHLAASNVVVKIHPDTGETRVFARRTVVEEVADPATEVQLEEARRLSPGVQLEDAIDEEVVPDQHTGRIAAQTAKQVVLQRLREAEREVVYDEYAGREGDIISGEVLRMEGRNVIVDLAKAEALLPSAEQVRNEHYRSGQRLKLYVLEVYKAAKGPQVVVSRTHKNLIRRLFELEVPEIFKGIVELKGIAREGGYRSKVAVWSTQDGVDPVGACVGLRGLRIQNVVNELNGERIDVVLWDPEPSRFVAHALSPAQVVNVRLDAETNTAEVVVPDRQLSLAIGKEGQNARLAAKLTGWRIDIKSETAFEEALAPLSPEEREAFLAKPEPPPEPVEEAAAAIAEAEELTSAEPAKPLTPEEEAVLAFKDTPATEGSVDEAPVAAEVAPSAEAEPAKPAIRFAEEIFAGREDAKSKQFKSKKEEEEAAKPAKKAAKRPKHIVLEEEDEEYDIPIH